MPGSHLYLQHCHNSASPSELTHAERRLWAAFRFERGVDLDFGDPESGGPDRAEVCGQFIAELLSQERQAGSSTQFQVRGIHITGILDLRYTRISCPIVMHNCHFANAVSLEGARCTVLVLEQCSLPRLDAENIEIDGDFRLNHLKAYGKVNIRGAALRHDLHLEGAELYSQQPDGMALCADNISVAGNIYLTKLTAMGTVSMAGARVRGSVEMTDAEIFGVNHIAFNGSDLEAEDGIDARGIKTSGKVELIDATFKSSLGFRGGRISNPGAIALVMDRASIAGSIFLGNGFSAEGQVRAIGASVGGSLYMDNTRIIRPPRALNNAYPEVGMRDIGKIIRFERIEVHGDMDLGSSEADKFFYAVGEVVLADAQVGGQVSLDGASLSALNSGEEGKALDADRMHIKRGLHLGEGFTATGQVSIANAQVGDSLLLGPATFIVLRGPAFDARGIHVFQDLIAQELSVYGSTILASAKIEGTLTLPTRGLSAPNAAAVDLLGVLSKSPQLISAFALSAFVIKYTLFASACLPGNSFSIR